VNRVIPIVMQAGALSDTPAPTFKTGPSSPAPTGPAPAWVFVDDTPIDEAAIAREMQFHRADDPHQARRDAARTLVIRELLRRECARLGIEAVETEGNETPEEAQVRVLLDREAPVPEPDEASCRRYFENHREQLHTPDRVRVRHILIAAAPADADARLQARQTGERLIEALQENPARFAEFAANYSACPSREQGGDLEWIERGDTTPEFERQLFMLKPGLAGLTVESRWGHHVVHVDEIHRGQPLEYEQAASRIASYLQTQARQNAVHQYLRQLHVGYRVRGLDD